MNTDKRQIKSIPISTESSMENVQKTTGIAKETFVMEIDTGKGLYNVKGEEKNKKISVNKLIKCFDYHIMVGFKSQPREYIVNAIKYLYFSV